MVGGERHKSQLHTERAATTNQRIMPPAHKLFCCCMGAPAYSAERATMTTRESCHQRTKYSAGIPTYSATKP